MPKLNQIIAIEKGVKSRVLAAVTDIYKTVQKPALFNGFSKTYRKLDDADPALPSEKTRVQFEVSGVLRQVAALETELMDVTARKDWTNASGKANADVKLEDGTVILPDVPVSYLLFLEKRLVDLRTLLSALPVLDDAEKWSVDTNSGLQVTDVSSTHRTKKIEKPIVLYPATPEHPAQTKMVTEDVIAGFWDTVKQSGAMPKPKRDQLVERVEILQRAVKMARETANMVDVVEPPKVGNAIFSYLMED